MRNVTFLFCVLFVGTVHATNTTNDYWYGFFNKQKINEDYSWWTEGQLRYDLDSQRMQQTLYRTGLLRQLKNSEVGLLYAFIESGENKEHRLAFQHAKGHGTFSGFNLSHRMRLEFRSREDADNLAERFRYLLRGQGNLTKSLDSVIWNELFLNLRDGTDTGPTLVERNRFFLGIRKNISDSFDMEIGYLNQYVPRTQGNIMEHILVTYMFF